MDEIPENWRPREELTREIGSYAEELVKEFPEITLRSWNLEYRMRGGQWQQPGLTLHLTGPELAVRAYVSCLGLARNLERIMIFQDIASQTGRTFDKPVKDFRVTLES